MGRTIEEIQSDYNQQCAILGDLVYKQRLMEVDKNRMLHKIKELQKEAARAAKKMEVKDEQSENSLPSDSE